MASSAQTPPSTLADQAPTDELMAQADAIAAQVAQIRGLALRQPMKKGVRTRAQLREALLTMIASEYSEQDLLHEALVLKRLHLLPQDADYKQMILELLTEQIAGFYDQRAKELYIMQGLPADLQRPTMAHEIFHVIQDQHFDILAMQSLLPSKTHSDFHLARSALLEGDATVLMIDFTLYEAGSLPQEGVTSVVDSPLLKRAISTLGMDRLDALESLLGSSSGAGQDSAMSRAPRMIRELLIFPYLGGLRFVLQARQGRTWEQFNAIYAQAPVSTEQILHPERYWAGDEPTLLEFDAAPPGSTLIYDNVMGELQLGIMLKAQLKDPMGQRSPASHINIPAAVEGWGGDRMVAYTLPSGQTVLVHVSSWDTTQDAAQFYKAMKASIERRHAQGPKDEPLRSTTAQAKYGQATCYTQRAHQRPAARHYIEQWGDLVLYIDGAPHPEATSEAEDKRSPVYAIRDAVWSSLKRVPFAQLRAQAKPRPPQDSPPQAPTTSAPAQAPAKPAPAR